MVQQKYELSAWTDLPKASLEYMPINLSYPYKFNGLAEDYKGELIAGKMPPISDFWNLSYYAKKNVKSRLEFYLTQTPATLSILNNCFHAKNMRSNDMICNDLFKDYFENCYQKEDKDYLADWPGFMAGDKYVVRYRAVRNFPEVDNLVIRNIEGAINAQMIKEWNSIEDRIIFRPIISPDSQTADTLGEAYLTSGQVETSTYTTKHLVRMVKVKEKEWNEKGTSSEQDKYYYELIFTFNYSLNKEMLKDITTLKALLDYTDITDGDSTYSADDQKRVKLWLLLEGEMNQSKDAEFFLREVLFFKVEKESTFNEELTEITGGCYEDSLAINSFDSKIEYNMFKPNTFSNILSDKISKSYFKETRLFVFGSNTMDSTNRAFNPKLDLKLNGETTFTFDMYSKCCDNGIKYDNPFLPYLINETKIKVFWKNKWYDFIIKNVTESSTDKKFSFSCIEQHVWELSKQGYNITLQNDLFNNSGSVTQLVNKVIKDTDWLLDDADNNDLIQDKTEDYLYLATTVTSFRLIDDEIYHDEDVEEKIEPFKEETSYAEMWGPDSDIGKVNGPTQFYVYMSQFLPLMSKFYSNDTLKTIDLDFVLAVYSKEGTYRPQKSNSYILDHNLAHNCHVRTQRDELNVQEIKYGLYENVLRAKLDGDLIRVYGWDRVKVDYVINPQGPGTVTINKGNPIKQVNFTNEKGELIHPEVIINEEKGQVTFKDQVSQIIKIHHLKMVELFNFNFSNGPDPNFKGERYLRGRQNEYDILGKRYLDLYIANLDDIDEKYKKGDIIRRWIETEYLDTNILSNFVTNGSDFYTTKGWQFTQDLPLHNEDGQKDLSGPNIEPCIVTTDWTGDELDYLRNNDIWLNISPYQVYKKKILHRSNSIYNAAISQSASFYKKGYTAGLKFILRVIAATAAPKILKEKDLIPIDDNPFLNGHSKLSDGSRKGSYFVCVYPNKKADSNDLTNKNFYSWDSELKKWLYATGDDTWNTTEQKNEIYIAKREPITIKKVDRSKSGTTKIQIDANYRYGAYKIYYKKKGEKDYTEHTSLFNNYVTYNNDNKKFVSSTTEFSVGYDIAEKAKTDTEEPILVFGIKYYYTTTSTYSSFPLYTTFAESDADLKINMLNAKNISTYFTPNIEPYYMDKHGNIIKKSKESTFTISEPRESKYKYTFDDLDGSLKGKQVPWIEYVVTCNKDIPIEELRDTNLSKYDKLYGLFLNLVDHPKFYSTDNRILMVHNMEMFEYMKDDKEDTDTDIYYLSPGWDQLQTAVKTNICYYNYTQLATDEFGIINPALLALKYTDLKTVPTIYKDTKEWDDVTKEKIEPLYWPNFKAVRTIEAKQSNRFNILQSIAEKFKCYFNFVIDHYTFQEFLIPTSDGDELIIPGQIKKSKEGVYKKIILIKKDSGKYTGIAFEYGIDVKSIQRDIKSNDLITKTWVVENYTDVASGGVCTIADSIFNPSLEKYVYNFDYYTLRGLIDRPTLLNDLYSIEQGNIGLFTKLNSLNWQYKLLETLEKGLKTSLLLYKSLQKTIDDYIKACTGEAQEAWRKLIDLYRTDKVDDAALPSTTEMADWIREAKDKYSNSTQSVKTIISNWYLYSYNTAAADSKQYDTTKVTETISKLEKYLASISNTKTAITDLKNEIIKIFNNKYGRFISEGSWNSGDYYDNDKYYLDSLEIAYTSARPLIEYSISLNRLEALEDFSLKVVTLGDLYDIIDREFFGYEKFLLDSEVVTRPKRERVVVSGLTSNFDSPDKDVITVQNYYTQFESLFLRIVALMQSYQYASGKYDSIASKFATDGTIYGDVLNSSLANISAVLSNKKGLDTVSPGFSMNIQYLSNAQTLTTNGGVFLSYDGGNTYIPIISQFLLE